MPKSKKKIAKPARLRLVPSETEQNKINDFLLKILVFVDRNGKLKSKSSNPVHTSLTMEYENGDLNIKMHAMAAAQGNGGCGAQVRYKGKKVYFAAGSYTTEPYDVEVQTYVKGEWEKLIKDYPDDRDE